MRVLFAGGGTAGHINPALAIANHLIEKTGNTEVRFVGTDEGLEVGLIPRNGFCLDLIRVHGFERKLSLKNVKNLCEIPFAIGTSKKIIKKFKPDVVVGTGGYVCGPVLYAAAKMKIPTFIHESNAFPGITTKILSKYVDVVALGMEAAGKYLKDTKNVIVTGNPIRPSILSTDSFAARRKLGLDERPFIVIFGGSLGARDFNASVAEWITKVAQSRKYQILMGTGKNNQYDAVIKRLKEKGFDAEKHPDIKVNEYIYDMDIAMNAADVVVSRSGASTLAELTAIGKPAVLVPSPYVTDNHQEHNARAVEKVGGAVVITENDFTAENLEKTLCEIIENSGRLAEMRKASAQMGMPDSADVICDRILKLQGK